LKSVAGPTACTANPSASFGKLALF
jgi:hypothetical protein